MVAQLVLQTVKKYQYGVYLHMTILTLKESEIRATMDVVKQTFTPSDGPFYQCLEKGLKMLNVERQAYHGAFVGNHVNKLLKVYPIVKCLGV